MANGELSLEYKLVAFVKPMVSAVRSWARND